MWSATVGRPQHQRFVQFPPSARNPLPRHDPLPVASIPAPVSFFPRQTIEWHIEEPRAFRRLSLSLVEMALLTGVLLRVYRSFVFTHGVGSWLLFGTIALGLLFLLFMTTAHLANFPIQRWAWRAPAFAGLEALGEIVTSVALILIGREPMGSTRAELHDWPSLAIGTIATRAVIILVWSLLLAGTVQIVRRLAAGEIEDEKEEAPGVARRA